MGLSKKKAVESVDISSSSDSSDSDVYEVEKLIDYRIQELKNEAPAKGERADPEDDYAIYGPIKYAVCFSVKWKGWAWNTTDLWEPKENLNDWTEQYDDDVRYIQSKKGRRPLRKLEEEVEQRNEQLREAQRAKLKKRQKPTLVRASQSFEESEEEDREGEERERERKRKRAKELEKAKAQKKKKDDSSSDATTQNSTPPPPRRQKKTKGTPPAVPTSNHTPPSDRASGSNDAVHNSIMDLFDDSKQDSLPKGLRRSAQSRRIAKKIEEEKASQSEKKEKEREEVATKKAQASAEKKKTKVVYEPLSDDDDDIQVVESAPLFPKAKAAAVEADDEDSPASEMSTVPSSDDDDDAAKARPKNFVIKKGGKIVNPQPSPRSRNSASASVEPNQRRYFSRHAGDSDGDSPLVVVSPSQAPRDDSDSDVPSSSNKSVQSSEEEDKSPVRKPTKKISKLFNDESDNSSDD